MTMPAAVGTIFACNRYLSSLQTLGPLGPKCHELPRALILRELAMKCRAASHGSSFITLATVMLVGGCDRANGTSRRGGDAGTTADASSCNSFGRVPDCPTDLRYCCGDSEPYVCLSGFSATNLCREEPIGGRLMDCDSVSGDACPADHPICCFEPTLEGATYCTDHAYLGPNWTCSQ